MGKNNIFIIAAPKGGQAIILACEGRLILKGQLFIYSFCIGLLTA